MAEAPQVLKPPITHYITLSIWAGYDTMKRQFSSEQKNVNLILSKYDQNVRKIL